MAKVIWSQPAVAEFAILYAFIEERSPAAAARLEERVRVATLQLETFPESGRPSRQFGEARREVVVAPYLLVYYTEHDNVFIVAVVHSARSEDTPEEIHEQPAEYRLSSRRALELNG